MEVAFKGKIAKATKYNFKKRLNSIKSRLNKL